MIIREQFENNDGLFIKTYSDISVYIKNNKDELFIEAIDPIEFKDERSYTETNLSIEVPQINEIPNERFPL